MAPVPDHIPAAAAAEHAVLIVALDAGDLEGVERRRAQDLAGACPGCASLRADLAILRAATATIAAPARTRDYRLTDADAERLRPSTWRQIIGWLGSPRSTVRPLAGGLAALGIVGLLLTTTPGIVGQATTGLTAGAAVAAPSTAPGPGAAATAPPAVSPAFGAPEASLRAAALPAPSPAAAALPSAASGASVLTGPVAPTAPPSTDSAATGAMDSGAKAGVPGTSGGERNASLAPVTETPAPDRTLPLLISLGLFAVGVALLLTNRMLRRPAGG